MTQRLKDKVCIITGAGSGIGRGTALLFAEHGAKLVLVDRNLEGLMATQDLIAEQGEGAHALAVRADVSKAADIERVVENTLREHGRVDVVFNNAGIMHHGEMLDFAEQTWDDVMDVNVKGMFLMCKAVIPAMLVQGGGSIINTSSVMATLTEPGYEAYTSSKAAVIGLSKAIAVSYAEKSIRCNALCPGWVDTPMNRDLVEQMGGLDKLTPLIKAQQPTGRMATAREVAQCVLFLASDESSAVTGSALYVDGASTAAI
jgi:NAD(P)-dependent dehydrogenase (short-subunit alcohol dehydrogenase family)